MGRVGDRGLDRHTVLVIIAVLGPTATGKSDLAVQLARVFNGEIINADALQLYRGMDIGTAKMPLADRAGITHHLLDVLSITEEASVAAYQIAAERAINDVLRRGRRPIVVGGSGLYLTAALDHLKIPPTDPQVRARLQEWAQTQAPGVAHERLRGCDPQAAQRILPGNIRRIVRALEVIELTGQPFTASLPQPRWRRPTVALGLTLPSEVLAQRIEQRVQGMWAAGLLAEVTRLVDQGLGQGRTAARAVGYAQALAQLSGELSPEQAQAETVRLTKRLARRQRSWFGRDQRTTWLAVQEENLLDRACAAIAAVE